MLVSNELHCFCVEKQWNAAVLYSFKQIADQPRTAGQPLAVHVVHPVEKRPRLAADLAELDADMAFQPLKIFADVRDVRVDKSGISAVFRHLHHIGAECFTAFLMAFSLLLRRSPGGNPARSIEGITCCIVHLFEHDRLEAQVMRLNGCNQTSRTGAEDDDVVRITFLGVCMSGCGSGDKRTGSRNGYRSSQEITTGNHFLLPF